MEELFNFWISDQTYLDFVYILNFMRVMGIHLLTIVTSIQFTFKHSVIRQICS